MYVGVYYVPYYTVNYDKTVTKRVFTVINIVEEQVLWSVKCVMVCSRFY